MFLGDYCVLMMIYKWLFALLERFISVFLLFFVLLTHKQNQNTLR